jgi:hypothetical protein
VWRTNDIVYLPDSPRGRSGGQYFPRPLWEKNGTKDAFRFFIHEATGGSDHIVFNNPSVGVPGIEFFTWPDQWYHADKDLPENGDPTEMRRVAFIGAATGWASANLTDEMLPSLLGAVSDFGYSRVAERGIPRALDLLNAGEDDGVTQEGMARALNMISAAVLREEDAVRSVREIYSGSPGAVEMVDAALVRWEEYGRALRGFILASAGPGAGEGTRMSTGEGEFEERVPRIAAGIRGREFNLGRFDRMQTFLTEHPAAVDDLGLTRSQTSEILNWVNGERSVQAIRNGVAAWTGTELTAKQVADYLEILRTVGWIEMGTRSTPPPR